jgi:Terpene synthase family 2, C-terminal metal binding
MVLHCRRPAGTRGRERRHEHHRRLHQKLSRSRKYSSPCGLLWTNVKIFSLTLLCVDFSSDQSPFFFFLVFSVSRDMRNLFDSPHIYATFVEGVTTRLLPAILQQAIDHKASFMPTIEEWLDIRFRNFSLDCFMPFFEMNDPLPDEIATSPILQSFVKKGCMMAALGNVNLSFSSAMCVVLIFGFCSFLPLFRIYTLIIKSKQTMTSITH